MGSFGDRLRREREQRGITLDDIALTTKIRAGLLQALEEERFERLPGGIFNKGFVRAYARHLGLDEDQTVADYLVASGEVPVIRTPEGARQPAEPRIQLVRDDQEAESSGGSPGVRGLVAGLLVLVVVGAAAWFYYHRERNPETPETAAAPPAVSSPASTPSQNAAQSQAAVPPSPKEGVPEGAHNSSPAPASPESKAALSSPMSSTSDNSAVPGIFTVRVKADDECWLQIVSDDKSEEVMMEAGVEKSIHAKNRVTVRAGSVGALDIYFNGRRLPSQGQYGEVRTLVFGPEGLQVPAAKPISFDTANH